jgi:hypothetical protein
MTPEQIEEQAARECLASVFSNAYAKRDESNLDLDAKIVAILMRALEMATPDLSRDRRASLFNSDDE